jgi:hypothetical protein
VSRIPIAALRLLFVLLLLVLPNCSRKAERLVGNERLARGPGGLGVTEQDTTFAERDTDVPGLSRDTGSSLLVGRAGVMQAITLFQVSAWSLPTDTTAASSFSVVSTALHATSRGLYIPRGVPTAHTPVIVSLALTRSGAWDSTTVTWSSVPTDSVVVGQGSEDFTGGDLIIPLAVPYSTVIGWAATQAQPSAPRFALYSPSASPGGIAAYLAGSIKFRLVYNHAVLGVDRTDTLDTAVSRDLYVYDPAGTAPAGTEPTLSLGGFEEKGVVVRAPSPVFPDGASIDQATLLLRVDALTDTIPYGSGSTIDLEVRRVGADWSEGGASVSNLAASVPIAVYSGFAYHGPADSLIAIHLPGSVFRAWADAPSTNYGLLITAERGNLVPPLYLRSRESGYGPELRVAYTTPPGGRF